MRKYLEKDKKYNFPLTFSAGEYIVAIENNKYVRYEKILLKAD